MSVDSDEVEFEEVEEGVDIGVLVLPLEAKYVINDGQHRVAGIEEALRTDPLLARDTISVVVLEDGGLERSQQVFSDLNRTVHKTSKSLDILYDHRLPINRITMACMERVDLFRNRIDKERVSLSVRSAKFATLSGLQEANKQLLGDLDEGIDASTEEHLKLLAIDYWNHLTDRVDPWREIRDGDVKPPEARQNFISSYALALWALGAAGKATLAAKREADGPWADHLDEVKEHRLAKNQPGLAGDMHVRTRSGHAYANTPRNRLVHHVANRHQPPTAEIGDLRHPPRENRPQGQGRHNRPVSKVPD